MQYHILLYDIVKAVINMYERIRNLREDRDLTQSQIATILGCTQQAYSAYELGKRDIPTQSLILLAKYYGTTTDYLLGLTDKPKL